MRLVPYREYDPFQEMDRMLDNMRRAVNRNLALGSPWQDQPDIHQLALDLTEDDENVVVKTSIPGVSEDDVDINVSDHILTISAETEDKREEEKTGWHVRELRYGKFARSVQLPTEVNIDKANAEIENGILTITLPKTEPGPVKKIAVKAKKLLTGKKD
jgi:HSP20 family protein